MEVLRTESHGETVRRRLIRAWREARWWERAALGFALLPIPGPVDELVGLLVLRRIARRST